MSMTAPHSITVGSVTLPGRAFLAPMAGITDAPFRDLAERFGAGMVVSEMIASANLGTGQKEMLRKLTHTGKLPHVVQIAGNEEKWLTLGVKIAQDAGADIIDINMGCPSKKVTNGYAGSALMRVPDRAIKLIDAVIAVSKVPVTLKMRLGWNDEHINAPELAKRAEGAGVQMIAVHGRTRQQFYKGQARWGPVRDVVNAVNIPVIVNGDIIDETTAKNALDVSKAAAVMIGRGAQGKPWIIGQINAALTNVQPRATPVGSELTDLVITHHQAMLSTYGIDLGMRISRKHLRWYFEAANITLNREQSRALLTGTDPDKTHIMINQHMNNTINYEYQLVN